VGVARELAGNECEWAGRWAYNSVGARSSVGGAEAGRVSGVVRGDTGVVVVCVGGGIGGVGGYTPARSWWFW
jgi:hypothetical protein